MEPKVDKHKVSLNNCKEKQLHRLIPGVLSNQSPEFVIRFCELPVPKNPFKVVCHSRPGMDVSGTPEGRFFVGVGFGVWAFQKEK